MTDSNYYYLVKGCLSQVASSTQLLYIVLVPACIQTWCWMILIEPKINMASKVINESTRVLPASKINDNSINLVTQAHVNKK